MFEAMFFDGEKVISATATSIGEAVRAAAIERGRSHAHPSDLPALERWSVESVQRGHALSLPDEPNRARWDLWGTDAPLLIVWVLDRLTVPVGIVRRV